MKIYNYIIVSFLCVLLFCPTSISAKKLTAEAKNVIKRIQSKGSTLSGELTEFHKEFSAQAKIILQLETMTDDLKRAGFLGREYKATPVKYERIYAEYAKHISEIKDVFVRHYPKIQRAVADFNKSVYYGKDRIAELRSDDFSLIENELSKSKQILYNLQTKRSELDSSCPREANNKISKSCLRKWRNYKRQLTHLKRNLARLQSMKKIANLKDQIGKKLTQIMEQFVYKESDTVETLMNYAFNFDQYSQFIGTNGMGAILRYVKDLGKLNLQFKDLQHFQEGLDFAVGDMGTLIDKRLDHFMGSEGMEEVNMELRGEMLSSFDGDEELIKDMIKELETKP